MTLRVAAPHSSRRFRLRAGAATPYLFIAPWVIGFVAFTLGPLLFSLYISFFDWPLVGEREFTGVQNYVTILTDDTDFTRSLWVTLKFAAMFVPANLIVALFLAMLLNQDIFASGFFRAAFYVPSIISGVALVTIWSWLLSHEYGVINFMFSLVGIPGVNWLGSPNWAPVSIVLVSLWSVGATMLIFLAGLKGISKELYEAASLSGVGKIRQFFLITLPLLSPVLLFNLVTTVIAAFQQLTLALLLTKGGPVKSTYMLAMYIYDTAFKYRDMGYAAAMSWLMLLLIIALTLAIFKFSSMWVFYETEVKGDKA